MRLFEFPEFPPHFALERQSYAWKPIIIAQMATRVFDTSVTAIPPWAVLWLDAGNLVLEPLTRLREHLFYEGFYSPESSGTVRQWTHPKTLDLLQPPPICLASSNFAAGYVGFTLRSEPLLRVWCNNCCTPSIVCPAGSDRSNHRQDQAVLSCVAYKFGMRPSKDLFGVKLHTDKLTDEQVDALLNAKPLKPLPSKVIRP